MTQPPATPIVMNVGRYSFLFGSALAAIGWAVSASAQVTTTPPNAPAAAEPPADVSIQRGEPSPLPKTTPPVDTGSIAEIVVTAQRRSENLQNVPIAVSAVTAANLQIHGVVTTEDLAAAIPSLTILATSGFVQPRIRGVGNRVFGAGYESGVATYIDGVYIASAPASLFSLNNIERVEVLKGPQGTLFGRNATGGLIQIITLEPSHNFGGTVSLTAENYETFAADGYVTGGLSDTLALDLGGHVSTQGKGYGINHFNGQQVNRTKEDINVRSSIVFQPVTGTKVRLSFDYEENQGSVYGAVRLAPGTGFLAPLAPQGRAWDVSSDIQPFNSLKAGGVSGHIDQDLGFGSLVSITAYRQSKYRIVFDGDGTLVPLVGIDVTQRDVQFSQELQLAAKPSSSVKWVVGAYYFKGTSRYDPSQVDLFGPFSQTPFGPIAYAQTLARLRSESLAGYAQATAPIFDRTNLTLGVRYTTETRKIDARTLNGFVALPAPVPGPPIAPQSKRFSQPTFRASLDHRFSPDVLLYASYNRGFKSGGFNGQFPTDPAFRPEKIDAYEVGLKTDLLDRHLRLDAAGFYYDYKDIQVAKYTGSQISYYNGASARIYGIDADIVARPTQALTLTGGVTLLHDRFTNFPNAIISTQVPTGIVVAIGSATGNRLPQTPDLSATIGVDYLVPLKRLQLGIDASYSYNDGFFSQPDNILRQPAYHLLGAGVRLIFPNGLTVRAWGRNLLNAKIFSTLDAGSFDSEASYQAPRTYGITAGVKF